MVVVMKRIGGVEFSVSEEDRDLAALAYASVRVPDADRHLGVLDQRGVRRLYAAKLLICAGWPANKAHDVIYMIRTRLERL